MFRKIICLILFAFSAQAEPPKPSEGFAILPLIDYSAENSVGVGAELAWFNLLSSGFDAQTFVFSSPYAQQMAVGGSLTNRNLFNFLYFSFAGSFFQNSRSYFYGFGNDSSQDNKVQYAMTDHFLHPRLGFDIFTNWTVGIGWGERRTSLSIGTADAIPQYQSTFTMEPYLQGTSTSFFEVFLITDARDSTTMPQNGYLFSSALAKSQPKGDEPSYQRIASEFSFYWPISENELVLAQKIRHEKIWGTSIPFFLQPKLGGMSVLKGYRRNRFIDTSEMAYAIEPRWTFWSPKGGTFDRFEINVGAEVGRVYGESGSLQGLHSNWLLGLTGVLTGGIPLRLDYAMGPEGSLFYLHLLYML